MGEHTVRPGYFATGLLLSLLGILTGCVERSDTQPNQQPVATQSAGNESADKSAAHVGIQMVLIPGGEFLMGCDDQRDASPAHKVAVSSFYMDCYEVTQEVYARTMGHNPARHTGAQNPVERVRWTDALKFCNARSLQDGLTPCYDLQTRACDFAADGYRLPTEAEWEYACRAGSVGDYNFAGGVAQLADHAWFRDNARRKHRPVGQKAPNAFGLYDMVGNVREWCNDWYAVDYYAQSPAADPRGPSSGEKTVLRGGAFSGSADSCTCWARFCDEPGFADACVASDDYGFRCVRRAEATGTQQSKTGG
jgi:formylglycine-generating enzyme required for sulfatase activity